VVSLIEGVTTGAMASILLLDRDGVHLRHGAAPRLPERFVHNIDGAAIGPMEGSCGAAAFLREQVIVEDIASHPNWRFYKQLALPLGLRACWSTPIFSTKHDVLGTFAIYYHEPRRPSVEELDAVAIATHLASLAIERSRADEDLRESERRYRQLYASVDDIVYEIGVDREGEFRFSSVNPAFTRVTGISAEFATGKRVREIVPPESIDRVLSYYRQAIAEHRTVSWEETSTYPTGVKHGDVSVTPIFDAQGHWHSLVGTVHDTTERRRADARIAEQASLLDKAHDAIVVIGVDARVQYWNHGATKLYGFARDEALGKSFADLVQPESAERELLRGRLFREGQSTREVRRTTCSGAVRIVESSATLLRDSAGVPSAVLLIETDITERKALELQFHRSQRLESLGTMASGITHDFNNILMSIMGCASLAMRAVERDSAAHEALTEIVNAARHAGELTRRILAFSRGQQFKVSRIDLSGPVGEALALLRSTITAPIELRTEIEESVPWVLADPTAIHQLLINLATNAAHAIGHRRGCVEVSLKSLEVHEPRLVNVGSLSKGSYAVLSVGDDGAGMDRHTVERMFDPYFTTRKVEGTGLGLWVVHGIVINHLGAIEVQSEVGQGTTIRVYLPALVTEVEPVVS
jgi:PAS domain S-box-containing protein